ncbi:hypothetical protein MKX01_018158 [Papaver californicum]|nr:hypothetical protein MKX01_018158 [Papaver californicum]
MWDYLWHSTVLLSFNFSKESFRMIPLPNYSSRLDVVGGDQRMIVHITRISDRPNDAYEVHALNDYDDNKLHTFSVNHPYYGTPKEITKNGLFGFLCGIEGGLVFVNFVTDEMKDIEIIDASLQGPGDVVSADVYKESLVLIIFS